MSAYLIGKSIYDWTKRKFSGHPVVFHHVPKCGGTSISHALRVKYLFSCITIAPASSIKTIEILNKGLDEENIIAQMFRFREQKLIYNLFESTHCIQGHIRFSDAAYDCFHGNYKFITTMRDPVSLFISQYFYNLTSGEERWRPNISIDEFLTTQRAKNLGSLFSIYFSGLPYQQNPSSNDALERAKKNIEKLDVIGFVDDMEDFKSQVQNALNITIRIPHENKARVDQQTRDLTITPKIRSQIEILCSPNMELYEHARWVAASRRG